MNIRWRLLYPSFRLMITAAWNKLLNKWQWDSILWWHWLKQEDSRWLTSLTCSSKYTVKVNFSAKILFHYYIKYPRNILTFFVSWISGNFTVERELSKDLYEYYSSSTLNQALEVVKRSSNEYWRCDPAKHSQGETYVMFTELLQVISYIFLMLQPKKLGRSN